jgi:F0F1-type ATP synthase membrane subunit b/b'
MKVSLLRNVIWAELGLGSVIAFAAGDGHGHVTDLIAPLVNVIILLSFLIWKLKKPFANHFSEKSANIKNAIERASIKAKEVELMLAKQKSKNANLDNEIKNMENKIMQDLEQYKSLITVETSNKIEKLKEDAKAKIAAERKELLEELNNILLNEVIAKTKNNLSSDRQLQTQAAQKMLEGTI